MCCYDMKSGILFSAMLALLLAVSPRQAGAADASPPAGTGARSDDTNSEVMRAYLQLQEQLHATQLAIQQSRKESDKNAAEAAQALADRLQGIEQALASQRARELDAMQSSNRVMLVVAGAFATIGFLAMLFMAFFQWRTVHSLAEISASIPPLRALGPGAAMPILGPGESQVVAPGPAEQSSQKLFGAMDRLEKRVLELEHSTDFQAAATGGNGKGHAGEGSPADPAAERLSLLLGKGQSMLNLDNAEAALASFDEALAVDPKNTDALVKKGVALERLQKLDDAIRCYDEAIAVNGGMTIAYLHKGGLFNRMERFTEALECYEKALRTQQNHEA